MDGFTNEQLVYRIQAGEAPADNMLRLWQQNKGLINIIADRYKAFAEFEDLQQEGYIALCNAAAHYDAAAGCKFSSFAGTCISRAMRRYICECCALIRIPEAQLAKIRRYKDGLRRFREVYGVEPSARHLARFLGVSEASIKRVRETAHMGKVRSLSEPVRVQDGEEIPLEEMIPDDSDVEEDAGRRHDLKKAFRTIGQDLKAILPEDEREAIILKFGGDNSIPEVAAILKKPVAEVRRAYARAIDKLRNRPRVMAKYRRYHEIYLSAHSFHHVGAREFRTTWTSEPEREALRRMPGGSLWKP